jgi:aspartate/methionine/tyrosine aminotransferase
MPATRSLSPTRWPNYEAIVHLAGAVQCFLPPARRGFLPDPGEIATRVTPRTKAIVINSPCNPTGPFFPHI